jgi:hypothetical protein
MRGRSDWGGPLGQLGGGDVEDTRDGGVGAGGGHGSGERVVRQPRVPAAARGV